MEKLLGKPPKALEEKPEENEIINQYVGAFSLLSSRRSANEKIQVSEMRAYAKSICEINIEHFIRIISKVDDSFLKEIAKIREAKEENDDSN